jgi:diguanylate cyclase (GGDEF)-like protein/PAS domain S-box-containing protein
MAETAALMGTIKTHTLFSQTSVDGKITDVNEAFCQISGYTRDELIGRSHSIVNSNCHSPSFWAEFWRSITAGKAWRGEICNRNKKGQLYWVDSIVMPFLNGDGEIQRYVSIRFEITERKQAEEALARMGRILDDSSNEIYVFQADSLHFSQLNRGARENLGYTADEITSLTPIDIKPDYTRESFVEIIQPLLQHKTDRLSFETLHLRKDGSRYPVAINLQYAAEETPPVFVAIVQDITERKAKDERIERLAFYDPLTGLPNRALMTDRLRKCVERAKTDACTVQLLYLDLDRFKEINDTRGHAIGDRFLAAVAHRFQSVVRPSETLARIGGDEFVILIEDGDETRTFEILKRLKAQLRRPIAVDGKSHSLGVSIGVATYPQSGKSPEALLQLADIAMYHAKAQGGGHRFYDHEMGEQLARRLQIADRLADALASNRLELHYQPIVELETGRLMGAEALLRWHETDWGWVPPDEFIPIAEERRMLVEIGPWVIDRACWQYADWRRQGLRCPQRLSVNVAAQQMEGATLLQSFQTSLKRHGVPASVMEAEITESSMMKDPQRTAEILTEMKALGVRLSIDDFGTGYSSLAYLNQFRTDKLKIDMSFVRDLMDDKNCQAIVSATIGMARGLGLSVLAEGVESHDQADHLRQLNCDEAQGYLFGKAVPADEFARVWLASPVDCALTGT